ncbi:hypothetical protein HNQ69_001549 [Bartonella callosciuri]|uniref:Uncharacterized protein n=1 Tax=Bartonella callosciuri TaxID=686223 RepID=A0A840P2A0_9HYPH|nr:hypothetical protein [Bartonella callosciuri]MBB5074407.1 hypothetical protein [Bartonella callosciuri]
MANKSENILSRLLNSLYAMDPLASRVLLQNQQVENAQQQANRLPYLTPSPAVGTVGLQPAPFGLAKDIPPLPNVSSALRSREIQPTASSSFPSMPMATVGSKLHPLGLTKDMEPLPNALSDLKSLQPQQVALAESSLPTVQSEQTGSVPLVQSQPGSTSQQSFWDQLRHPEFLQRLSDYAIGYASSDGPIAQSLANAAMNLRHGDMEREQKKQVNQTVEYLKSKGYSEEEARFVAGNKDALNSFLLQKVNGGYDTSSKEELDRQREMIELQNSEAISNNMLNDIERFMNYVNENGAWATGNLADWQASFNVPQHRDMKSLLNSIKNRIGIDRLEAMRRYSRNGASGLGNLTEKELDILKSYLGEIDYKLGDKELMFRLKKIREILGKMKSNVLALLEDRHTKLTEENVHQVTASSAHTPVIKKEYSHLPVVTSKEQEDALPSGTLFIGEDGKRRRKGA